MARKENRKSINFDLSTRSLNEIFGEGNRHLAYSQIKRFMLRSEFEHRQYSGYVSTNRMSFAEIYLFIKRLTKTCPWLVKCTKRFDVTDFLGESDALDYVLSAPDEAPISFDVV